MAKQNEQHTAQAPDQKPLAASQASRLASLTGLTAKELAGLSIVEINDKFRWKIDPEILFFRRICGKVVKTDPATGIDLPVPFATVNVYDTDCDFLGYFPVELPWTWFFPIFCRRELIGTTTADACGNFCVWVPRFEIDYILRWRLEWVCEPYFWIKPSISDLVRHLRLVEAEPNPVIPHGPGPVSVSALVRDGGRALQRMAEVLGHERGTQVQLAVRNAAIMGKASASRAVLEQPAFVQPVPPPASTKLAELHRRYSKEGARFLSDHFGSASKREHHLDLNRYVGPFCRWHCHLEVEEEIIPVLEIPDISFEVTQNVNGDGIQEVIYSGYFDVGWSSGPINDVTLHASQIAVPTLNCGPMNPIDCAQDGSGLGIVSASLMPLSGPGVGTPYFDPTTGYGQRPNPPHADGAIRASTAADRPSTAPLGRTLLLRGCNQIPGGQFYRVLYKFNGGAETIFNNLPPWPTFRPLGNTPVMVGTIDGNGWYNVLGDPGNWLVPYLLLAWPTYGFTPGQYELRLEIGDAAKNHLAYSGPVKLQVDSSSPLASFISLAWRVAQDNTLPCSDPSWTSLPLTCPVVRRNAGDNIEFCVSWQASATHLREAALSAYGCGAALAVLQRMTSDDSVGHRHTGPTDNNVVRSAIFRLNYADDNQGAYGFNISAFSRAFDPGDTTGYVADWTYDIAWFGGTANLSIAVVNA
jgi:hypothetical protein